MKWLDTMNESLRWVEKCQGTMKESLKEGEIN